MELCAKGGVSKKKVQGNETTAVNTKNLDPVSSCMNQCVVIKSFCTKGNDYYVIMCV